MLLGVDVGGTFTDAVVVLEDGSVLTAKSPSTPDDQSDGVIAAIDAVLKKAGRRAHDVASFAHGMTVATNALIEGRGARTALVATEGFTDVVELGRQNRADLYRLCTRRPPPLCPPELRFGVGERMTPDGPLTPLSAEAAHEVTDRLGQARPEAVAVALLHAYRHPEHELLLGEAIRRELPDVHISLSHSVIGTFREYERAATTEVDAALSPLLSRYLGRLIERTKQGGIPPPAIMQSNGGLIEAESAAAHAAWTVLSGPAAGAAGAAFVAREARVPDALCFDMGGTSCDVCVVERGSVREQTSGEVASRPLALPMLDVHTVGAGGGSIAWRDPGGALRVGPRSAGAEPGPACYGRGGSEPTVTDANLVLGLLSADAPLAGGISLRAELAERAIEELAQQLELQTTACAEGIVRVANAEMLRALRVVTVERGVDPRRHALVAFGGAGPLHAAQIAEELDIDTVICPRSSGVLAALGLLVSPRRRDVQQSVLLGGQGLTRERVASLTAGLAERAVTALGAPDAELRARFELRYRGQAFELAIEAPLEPDPAELREAFEEAHERRYGYADREQELELVTIGVSALVPGVDVTLASQQQAEPERGCRRATIGSRQLELEVLRGEPPAGLRLSGPAVVELPESTLLIPPGWAGEVAHTGSIHLRREPER